MFQQPMETRMTRRRTGFTLLELIAVMGIIVAMSIVVVGAYRGLMRAVAQRSGVDALAKAVTLCRQYATIDGQTTYFWITGFDKYVICRKAGKIDDDNDDRVRDLEDYEWDACGYLPHRGDKTEISRPKAYWVRDSYSDLGLAEDYTQALLTGSKEAVGLAMEKKEYSGGLAFDFSKGKVARIRYPPWFVAEHGYWIMGLMGPAKEDRPDGFEGGSVYGWMVGPEYQLPKGYVFESDLYEYDSRTGAFEQGARFHFLPDGTRSDLTPPRGNLTKPNVKLVIKEEGSSKRPSVTVEQNGAIDWDYDDD